MYIVFVKNRMLYTEIRKDFFFLLCCVLCRLSVCGVVKHEADVV